MKKIVWMIAAMACMSITGMAQVNPFENGSGGKKSVSKVITPKKLFISPYIALGWGTAATVDGNGIAGYGMFHTHKMAYDIGMNATLDVGLNNSLSFGPHIIQYRSTWDESSEFLVKDPERKDLALPLLFRMYTSSFKHRSGFFAVFGLEPSFLIDGGGDKYYDYNSFMLAAILGLGVHVSTSPNGSGFTLDLRLHQRLTRSGTFHMLSEEKDYPMNFKMLTFGLQYDIPVL